MSNAMNEVHGRIAARARNRARPGRHWMEQVRKAAEPPTGYLDILRPHELTSDNPSDESHFKAFTAALERGLRAVHERRNGHSRVFVICDDVAWNAIQEAMR